jgi:UDPglucose--hexose-1-phosphate uridylyltransferase
MSELRYNPIQGRWVIIAVSRSRRPRDLAVAATETPGALYCPFCPGHESRTPPEVLAYGRPQGAPSNMPGWTVRVFPNKYPALTVEGDLERRGVGPFDSMRGVGAHEVVVDSPEHGAELASMTAAGIATLLQACAERIRDLHRDRRLKYVLVFKNHGAVAGATLAHPHSQIIATPVVPSIVEQEFALARVHYERKERCLLCDVLRDELDRNERIVTQNDRFVALTPYASRFPFEVMIAPRHHRHDLAESDGADFAALARCLGEVARMLRGVLEDPPFNLVLHSAPNLAAFGNEREQWRTLPYDYHWYLEILPRLTRAAGFESGTDFYINPTAPEEAARFLREAETDPL